VTTGGRLAGLLAAGEFCVTGEVVPPRSANGDDVTQHARALVGYIDAANVTDNPVASPHMSALAGVRFVAEAGVEPTVQLVCRDRNRLGMRTCWGRGRGAERAVSGRRWQDGDRADAPAVDDLAVPDLGGPSRRRGGPRWQAPGLRSSRYLIGVADVRSPNPTRPAGVSSMPGPIWSRSDRL
jgi:methylenetetrahydrofolate reductase (NADPH)